MPAKEQVHSLFASISTYYDRMNDLMTLGLHRRWKKIAIELSQISKGQRLLDLCTGTGDLAFLAALKVGPTGEVIALDFCYPMLEKAQLRNEIKKFPNIQFKQADIHKIESQDNSFDAITISFGLRNTERPQEVLNECYRLLKAETYFICLEAGEVKIPFIAWGAKLYTQYLIPTLASLLYKNKSAYDYLPRSVKKFWTKNEMINRMEQVGFKEIQTQSFLFGSAIIYKGKK